MELRHPDGNGGNPLEPSKIVVRYLNGSTVKGFTQNFFPNKSVFHLTPLEGEGGEGSGRGFRWTS